MTLCTMPVLNLMNKPSKIFPGLEELEPYVGYYTYLYILRLIYRQLILSIRLKENKQQLQQRLQQLEEELGLPGLLSSLPIETLWVQLEDLQYLYPICQREIIFPTLH